MAQAAIPISKPAAAPAKAAASAAAASTPGSPLSYAAAPVRPLGAGAQAAHPQESVDLSEMFGELKHELEEDVATADEDPETHYNLGVAFREMGLLDEPSQVSTRKLASPFTTNSAPPAKSPTISLPHFAISRRFMAETSIIAMLPSAFRP